MRCALASTIVFAALIAAGADVRADHRTDLRQQVEGASALLDSHTRRLYYEVRSRVEGDDEQAQLLSDARDLWRAARRLNDRAIDGEPASRLEREARKVEDAFHDLQKRFQALRVHRIPVPPVSKRMDRIDSLVRQTHDGVHTLIDLEAGQVSGSNPQVVPGNYGYRTAEPVPRLQEAGRRAADYVEPAIRVRPDGFYFDGRGFTIPLGR